MLCSRGYFLAGLVRRGSPARVAQGGLVDPDSRANVGPLDSVILGLSPLAISPVPRGTQVSYPATIDLAERYGVSQVISELQVRQSETAGRLTAKIALMRGTLEAQHQVIGE
ncbi:hypothetical protein M9H77_11196 [Catharanthus roseus]|uniref:Uncharacterized protein n=1 Tax=Catharanthus roseus TaxID=4058 RepID=A0ACC0BDX9_CATRO|nr:hypothetical protein M9H77_11196 [Catharanthus roseus]